MINNKSKSSLVLACSLALVALPCAFAEHTTAHAGDAMFKSMDTNADGQISRAEHAAASKKMFTDADINHDGMVTLVEMTAVHGKMKADAALDDHAMKTGKVAQDDMSPAAMIKLHDQNGDGKLSAAEQTAGCDAMFTKMDKNADGWLSEDECMDGHKMMKK